MSYATQITIALVLVMLMFLGSALLTAVYTLRNAWYRSRVGWALVTLAASLTLVMANTLTGYFLHWGAWSAFLTYGLILLAIIVLDVAFLRERMRLRAEQRRIDAARKSHRVERKAP